jgi:ParB family chromosome partitioning protein
MIQPIVVRAAGNRYELIAGERRLRACRLLRYKEVDCIVQRAHDQESAFMALVENLQRENLHFLEEAEGYQSLIDNYGYTQEELAQRLAKSQSTIANKLRVLRLSPAVKTAMIQAGLSERHARALLKLEAESRQLEAIRQIAKNALSVKETEALVGRMLEKGAPEAMEGQQKKVIRLARDYRLFVNSIKAAAKQLQEAGLESEMRIEDGEKGVEIRIFIPKT